MTCRAVCAATRPKFLGVVSTTTIPPISESASTLRASSRETSVRSSSTTSTTSFSAKIDTRPVSVSISASICCALEAFFDLRYAETIAAFRASKITSFGSRFCSTTSLNANSNSFFILALSPIGV